MQFKMVHGDDDRASLLYFLSEDVLDLVLQYRIELVRVEPTTLVVQAGHSAPGDGTLRDDEGNTFNLQTWEEWEWYAFTSNFAPMVTDFWSGRFELTPNRAWFRQTATEKAKPLKVACDLSIELMNSPARAHHRYFIFKPVEETFRSFVNRGLRTGMFTDRDLSPSTYRRQTMVNRKRISVSYFQTTILHEFGHTLGLHHVAAGGNAADAYGITLDDRTTLMGFGGTVNPTHAQPWVEQLRRHLIPGANDGPLRFTARVTKEQTPTHMYIG